MKKLDVRLGLALASSAVLAFAIGCEITRAGFGTEIDGDQPISDISDEEAKELCIAFVEYAATKITHENVCQIAGVGLSDGDEEQCEDTVNQCEDDAGFTAESEPRDAEAECEGFTADVFEGCDATVREVELCVASLIKTVAAVSCENPEPHEEDAAVEADCAPILEDEDCGGGHQIGQALAGGGFHIPHSGGGTGGGNGMGGDGNLGGAPGSGGGTSTGGGTSSGGGGPAAAPADCFECSGLDCYLSPRRRICDAGEDVCLTSVRDAASGRQIDRSCGSSADVKPVPAACADVEKHVMADGVVCDFYCSGAGCNQPSALRTSSGTPLN